MTGNLNLFSNIDKSIQTDVTLGNNVQFIVLGKVIVGILTKQGSERLCMILHMESPKDSHWKAGKRVMRYVSGTIDLGNMYSTLENFKLIGYIDSENGGKIDDRKSTSGYTFNFGTCVVSWDSKKQPIVTL